jgi:hypothetical protein
MVICSKCGVENPLGRVFCGACGSKLDLAHMTSDTVAQAVKVSWISIHWPKFVVAAVILLLAVVALAFWPQTAPIGKEGNRLGGQRVQAALRALQEAQPGRAVARDFSDEDINGFFRFFKTEKLNVESLSVQVSRGYFRVRVIRVIAPLRIGSFQLMPRVSQDLYCVPVGGTVRVRRVVMGHLSWLGPFRSSIVRRTYALLAGEPEWRVLANASEIRADDGKIWVNVSR